MARLGVCRAESGNEGCCLNPSASDHIDSIRPVCPTISGFALSLIPLMRSGLSLWVSFRSIWLGETISIGVMEFAMNFADYHVGGVTTNSMLEPLFWIGFGAAIVAGFIAAWPINFYMLKTNLKQVCH